MYDKVECYKWKKEREGKKEKGKKKKRERGKERMEKGRKITNWGKKHLRLSILIPDWFHRLEVWANSEHNVSKYSGDNLH